MPHYDSGDNAVSKHTLEPWTIGKDETPWTCGDSQTAIECGEPFGHTEILFPILNPEGDPLAYLPWEPLANQLRVEELRANAQLIINAPRLYAALGRLAEKVEAIVLSDGSTPDTLEARTVLAEIDGGPSSGE